MFQSSIQLNITHNISPVPLIVNIKIEQNNIECFKKQINLQEIHSDILIDFNFNLANSPLKIILETKNILIKKFCLVINSILLDDLFMIPRITHSGKNYNNNSVGDDIGNTLYAPGTLIYQLTLPLISNVGIVKWKLCIF